MSRQETIDEAGAWLALLHREDRSAQIDEGFRRWLEKNPEHREVFDAASQVWEASGRLRAPPAVNPTRARNSPRARWQLIGAAAALAGIASGLAFYLHARGVVTDLGEQRTLTLDDGSRVVMNTSSQVRVRFTDRQRRVELVRGEALFEVAAKSSNRPFVVAVADREIAVLGTSFIVRRDAHQTAVTLVEGKIAVRPAGVAEADPVSTQVTTLSPGERLTFAPSTPPRIDFPALANVTAWRRGRVDLNNTPLAEAAEEMNRYSRVKLIIDGAEAAAVPVRGSFRAGDTEIFSAAMAQMCGLEMVESGQEIHLRGRPTRNCQ